MKSELRELLAELDEAVSQLRASLASETDALARRDADLLVRITGAKTATLARIEQLEQRRRAWCGFHRIDAEPAGMLAAIDGLGLEGQPLRLQWDHLRSELLHCRRINRSNGLALTALQRRVRQSLQLLNGRGGPAELYGRNGAAETLAAPRALARA
jgi:flagellar biosynthesis/type III secretory pathway chaperone